MGHLACHTPQVRRADEPDDRRTLERLARAQWPEQAGVQVRSVITAGDRTEVTLTVNGHYDYWVYYQRGRRRLGGEDVRQRAHDWLGGPERHRVVSRSA